jgi:hypothetical protein
MGLAHANSVISGTYEVALKAKKVTLADPIIEVIGDPQNLNNYVTDSRAAHHMSPRLADMYGMEEGQNLDVQVADSHIIKVAKTESVNIEMLDNNGIKLEAV